MDLFYDGLNFLQQRVADHYATGGAIFEDVDIILLGEERIQRDGHDSGLQRAPEYRGEIDAIVHQHGDPLALPQTRIA